jgi:hypothetical protein
MSLGVRWTITYHGPVVAAWLLLTAAYAFLAALHAVAAAVFIGVLFLAAAAWSFLSVTRVEDFWHDFRGQRRLAAITGALLLGTLAAGVGLGWWLTA